MPLFGKKHIKQDAAPEVTSKAAKVTKAKTVKAAPAKKEAKAAVPAVVAPVAAVAGRTDRNAVLKGPRVTEKAGLLAEKGVYTFNVAVGANSQQIATAIKAAYKVTPVKISIAPVMSKAMFVRGKSGKTVTGKKAYVYLKKGDKIDFI
jgi:large subunit ribosomal protein L23